MSAPKGVGFSRLWASPVRISTLVDAFHPGSLDLDDVAGLHFYFDAPQA